MTTEGFRRQLLDQGLLVDAGVPGLYQRSFAFETIVRAVEAYVSRAGSIPSERRLYFPPVIAQSTLLASGYANSFPNLMGVISSFAGGDRDLPDFLDGLAEGTRWTSSLTVTDVALCSAACHPLFAHFAHQVVASTGLLYEVQGVCFRHEPSLDPARMQSFRQHEFVYLGSPEGALAHRDDWLERGARLLGDLGLEVDVVPANDPFFGRVGRVLASGQLDKELKFEVTAPISSDVPGAIASANYHEDHMGHSFDITVDGGALMHSACFGLGLDRIALALVRVHGLDVESWPTRVRELLTLPPALNGST
jgi:seryl-tRNA synthetase